MRQDWEYRQLDDVCSIDYGTRVVQKNEKGSTYFVYGGGGATFKVDRYNREDCFIVSRFAMSPKCTRFVSGKFFLNDSGLSVSTKDKRSLRQSFVDKALLANNDAIYAMGKGVAQKNLDMPSFRRLQIPIPPIPEQEKIVAELDCLTGIIEKKKQQLKELDKLAQSIFYDMFGDPITNEKGWDVKKLGEVCETITDGTHFSPKSYETGDYKYITAKNIKKDGFDFKELTYLPKETHKEIYSRCSPMFGDVLFIKDGATTGVAMINTLYEEFSLLSSVALLRGGKRLNNRYLRDFLNFPSTYKVVRDDMGGAAITRLTLKKIERIRIAVPPLNCQNEFAQRIEAIEKQKELVKRSIVETETLFNSRMDNWFN